MQINLTTTLKRGGLKTTL